MYWFVAAAWACALLPPAAAHDAISSSMLETARQEVARVKLLVEQGTLPRTRLAEAEKHLADAEDESVLSETLYGVTRLQDMSTAQAEDMVHAAERRVARQQAIVADRKGLLEAGVLARADYQAFVDELQSRERVLELARTRAKLLGELQQMAEAEKQLELSRAHDSGFGGKMIRFDGNGVFRLAQFPVLAKEFQRRFQHPLPVSAMGQTLLHRAMGLDHHNRIDVALNPDGPEGVWLRHALEHRQIPYLAFRGAVVGAATAPHIHIGPASTRLAMARP